MNLIERSDSSVHFQSGNQLLPDDSVFVSQNFDRSRQSAIKFTPEPTLNQDQLSRSFWTEHASTALLGADATKYPNQFESLAAEGLSTAGASMSLGRKALRVGQVSVEGLAYSVPGAWHALKHDLVPVNWGHTCMKLAAAGCLGAAMRVALPEASAVTAIAGTALTISFLKDAASPVLTAWKDVCQDDSDLTMNRSAHNLGESLGAFAVDACESGIAANLAGRLTPLLAERYFPKQWSAIEAWKNSATREKYTAGGRAAYGIGISAPDYKAFRNGDLDITVDTGHVFGYLRDETGVVTEVISIGPDTGTEFGSPKFDANWLSGRLPAKGDWPITDPVATYEWRINKAGYERAKGLIEDLRAAPPNYLPLKTCPDAPIKIGRALGLTIPSGVSDVYVTRHFLPAIPFPNPFGLQKQLNAGVNYPSLGSASEFQQVNSLTTNQYLY